MIKECKLMDSTRYFGRPIYCGGDCSVCKQYTRRNKFCGRKILSYISENELRVLTIPLKRYHLIQFCSSNFAEGLEKWILSWDVSNQRYLRIILHSTSYKASPLVDFFSCARAPVSTFSFQLTPVSKSCTWKKYAVT